MSAQMKFNLYRNSPYFHFCGHFSFFTKMFTWTLKKKKYPLILFSIFDFFSTIWLPPDFSDFVKKSGIYPIKKNTPIFFFRFLIFSKIWNFSKNNSDTPRFFLGRFFNFLSKNLEFSSFDFFSNFQIFEHLLPGNWAKTTKKSIF